MCARWRDSFDAFHADMGDRPSLAHTIDRRDNDRGYDCGACDDCRARGASANCRWATKAEQARNKSNTLRIEHNGRTQCLMDWSLELGIGYGTLLARHQKLARENGPMHTTALFRPVGAPEPARLEDVRELIAYPPAEAAPRPIASLFFSAKDIARIRRARR